METNPKEIHSKNRNITDSVSSVSSVSENEQHQTSYKSFVQFMTVAYGYQAAWKVLQSYYNHFMQERKQFYCYFL